MNASNKITYESVLFLAIRYYIARKRTIGVDGLGWLSFKEKYGYGVCECGGINDDYNYKFMKIDKTEVRLLNRDDAEKVITEIIQELLYVIKRDLPKIKEVASKKKNDWILRETLRMLEEDYNNLLKITRK